MRVSGEGGSRRYFFQRSSNRTTLYECYPSRGYFFLNTSESHNHIGVLFFLLNSTFYRQTALNKILKNQDDDDHP